MLFIAAGLLLVSALFMVFVGFVFLQSEEALLVILPVVLALANFGVAIGLIVKAVTA